MFVSLGWNMRLDPSPQLLTLSVFKGRWEKSHPKSSAVISLMQMTWFEGLVCVWHHLSASFGQDIAANDCLFLWFTLHPSQGSLGCLLQLFHPTGQDLSSSQETASIFSWAKQKCIVYVFSLQGPPHLCMSEGFLELRSRKDIICFYFWNPSFLKRYFWWYLLAFHGTEEKTEATLSCLDKRRKIKSWSNFILPKRKDRDKSICQREESHNQRSKTIDFVCSLDI